MAPLELILHKIEEMDRSMRESFHALGERMDRLEDGMARLEERMDRLEERMDRLEERMDRLEERMDRLEERMDRIEERMDRIEERVGQLEERMFKSEKRMDSMELFMEMNFERQQATLDLHSLKLDSIIEKLVEHDVLLAEMVTREEFDEFRDQTATRFDGLTFKVEHLEQEFVVFGHQLAPVNEKLMAHDVAIRELQSTA
jgi:chromosome segregation ATPase